MSARKVEEHHRSQMHPPWVPTGGRAEGNVCRLMEMGTFVMEFGDNHRQAPNTVSEREDEDHNRSEMQPPWESNTALGIEEPECVYVYVPASVFGANSL